MPSLARVHIALPGKGTLPFLAVTRLHCVLPETLGDGQHFTDDMCLHRVFAREKVTAGCTYLTVELAT
jgi:hypothetical protein